MTKLLSLLVLSVLPVLPALGAQQMIHSEKSLYREVLVYEEAGERCMCFTRACRIGRQSCLVLNDPHRFALNSTRMMMAGTLFTGPAPQRLLIVGLGGGSIPTALRAILPQAQVDGVATDPAVPRLAGRHGPAVSLGAGACQGSGVPWGTAKGAVPGRSLRRCEGRPCQGAAGGVAPG